MSYQSKKKMAQKQSALGLSTIGRVVTSQARFAHPGMDLNFAYFHAMDIWQRMDLDLRQKLKRDKLGPK